MCQITMGIVIQLWLARGLIEGSNKIVCGKCLLVIQIDFFVAKFNNQLGFLMNYSFCSLTSKKPLVENVLSQHHDGVMSKTHTTVLQKERTAKDRRGMELPRQR